MTIILICITATNSKQVSFLHPSPSARKSFRDGITFAPKCTDPGFGIWYYFCPQLHCPGIWDLGLLLSPSALTQDLRFGITFVPKCTDPGFGIWDYFCPQVHWPRTP